MVAEPTSGWGYLGGDMAGRGQGAGGHQQHPGVPPGDPPGGAAAPNGGGETAGSYYKVWTADLRSQHHLPMDYVRRTTEPTAGGWSCSAVSADDEAKTWQ